MKIIVILVLLYGCLCFENSSTSQTYLQEEVCTPRHKEKGSPIREFTALLKISVKHMVIDWSLFDHPPRPYFVPRPVMDPPHYRRRKRSFIPRMSFGHQPPSTPAYYNINPSQHTDCKRKYKALVSQVFEKYPSSMTMLDQGNVITVFGPDLLQENTDFFVTVQLGAASCGGAWKVVSGRKWSDLSDYQTDLLTNGTYLENCGSPESLRECFTSPANRKSQLDMYDSCFDKYSYCIIANKSTGKLEKKKREFNSCVNDARVNTPEPLSRSAPK